MRVYMKANGTLAVRAENELESYALHRWSGDYFNTPRSEPERKAFLLIEVSDECKADDSELPQPEGGKS